jgi:hypothetical protein
MCSVNCVYILIRAIMKEQEFDIGTLRQLTTKNE